ncbi:MAG TPA: glycine cleavage system protein H, partial [Acidimicrobiia bacterium]|nr:glycine cleavage system protein H [Acidimicrobiia bacterium]
MNVPDDLRYTADHEWVRAEGTRLRVGITDYAQDALGDIVFVQLPEPGIAVEAGASFSEV